MSSGSVSADPSKTPLKPPPPKSPRSRTKDGPVWRCVEVLRSGPNPRWRCRSCNAEFTGAPCRIAQHVLGEGGTGQIKACTCPQDEYVRLLRATMAMDHEGKLVKRMKLDKDDDGKGQGTSLAMTPGTGSAGVSLTGAGAG
ncbi:unnamed protein product, partial [Discosporangium mesarthrocarpum]